MRPILLVVPALLNACVAAVGAPGPGMPPPGPGGGYHPDPIVPGPGCDQTRLDPATILGRRPEELGIGRFRFPVRVVAPGMAVTMDYSPDRLTLETDENGRIIRFNCG